MKKIAFCFLVAVVFGVTFIAFDLFFKSDWMSHFIWNMNTFQGRFANLSDTIPKENIVGAYAYSIRDFNLHSTRTVYDNSVYYAWMIAFLAAGNLLWHTQKFFASATIFSLGIGARLFFAYHTTCNNDLVLWYSYLDIIKTNGNIYQLTNYNYSPVWFLIAKFFLSVSEQMPQLYFMFAVRAFLTFIDVFTGLVLMSLARMTKKSEIKVLALFLLNPITIIITGYHGQIDNLSILFLLLGIYVALSAGNQNKYFGWMLVTLGAVIKHQIIHQPLIYLNHFIRSKSKVLTLFALTLICFFVSFGSFWTEAAQQILRNVFSYGGMARPYGLVALHAYPWVALSHKYLFISLLLVWPFLYRTDHVLKSSLMGMLLVLVFTSGISTQSFVLPVALGALQPSGGFFLFSFAASLLLFGDIDELKMNFFSGMAWHYVWMSAVIWFLMEKIKKPVATP